MMQRHGISGEVCVKLPIVVRHLKGGEKQQLVGKNWSFEDSFEILRIRTGARSVDNISEVRITLKADIFCEST